MSLSIRSPSGSDGVDLLSLVGRDTTLRRVAGTRGGEYAGPCPLCGGEDRFRIQPEQGRWWCRGCRDRWGDAIDYIRWRDGISFIDACRALGIEVTARGTVRRNGLFRRENARIPATAPESSRLAGDAAEPSATWRVRGEQYVAQAEARLWSDAGVQARRWLAERGLTEESVRRWNLGYQPADIWENPAPWGLEGDRIWLPHGIVI